MAPNRPQTTDQARCLDWGHCRTCGQFRILSAFAAMNGHHRSRMPLRLVRLPELRRCHRSGKWKAAALLGVTTLIFRGIGRERAQAAFSKFRLSAAQADRLSEIRLRRAEDRKSVV